MNIVITVCLVYMLALFGTMFVRFCRLNRVGKLKFAKSFRRGKFAYIYLAAIPLYYLGAVYGGAVKAAAILSAIQASIELVALRYAFSSVSALASANLYFNIVIGLCFVLVTLNAIVFALALFAEGVSNGTSRFKASKLAKKVTVIVGFNPHNKDMLKSHTGEIKVLFVDYGQDVKEFCFTEKIAYYKISSDDNVGAALKKIFKKLNNMAVDVIVNTCDDAQNLVYAEQLSNLILEIGFDNYSPNEKSGVNAYVFGEPKNSSTFLHFEKKTKGRIHYINKYNLIAMDFVERYPITQFMNEAQIDYDTATVKSDVDINVIMIGFGETNEQIFLTSIANNQLLSYEGKVLTEKEINYWIYDKNSSLSSKNLNHSFFRYANEYDRIKEKEREYLPLPKNPANYEFLTLDINDMSFYDSIREKLKGTQSKTTYNYIIIGFATDMENIDFADKLNVKLKEWEFFDTTKVFTKIRHSKLATQVINKEYVNNESFFSFGAEDQIVYNIKRIVSEKTR